MRPLQAWSEFEWLNEPVSSAVRDGSLVVRTAPGTDFWRTTSYGFVHDNGHLFWTAVDGDFGTALDLEAEFRSQFDQAGLMLRASPEVWLKAGIEVSDGRLHASVVVTKGQSDWSVSQLPVGLGRVRLTVRASRVRDAVTVRFGLGRDPELSLLRVTSLPADRPLMVGPFCCSPTGPGLDVAFQPLRIGAPDPALHAE